MLVLTSRPASDRKVYLFMEEHGYWDPASDQFRHEVSSINTEDDMEYEDAFALYVSAKDRLAAQGFVHSFFADHNLKLKERIRSLQLDGVHA